MGPGTSTSSDIYFPYGTGEEFNPEANAYVSDGVNTQDVKFGNNWYQIGQEPSAYYSWPTVTTANEDAAYRMGLDYKNYDPNVNYQNLIDSGIYADKSGNLASTITGALGKIADKIGRAHV